MLKLHLKKTFSTTFEYTISFRFQKNCLSLVVTQLIVMALLNRNTNENSSFEPRRPNVQFSYYLVAKVVNYFVNSLPSATKPEALLVVREIRF